MAGYTGPKEYGGTPRETFHYWRDLADSGLAPSVTADAKDQIAAVLMEAHRREGDGASCLWHASALVHNTLDRCQCHRCEQSRGAA